MNIAKEELTFDGDGVPTYTVQITDFHHKMKNWSPTESITTKTFKVQDVDLHLDIYPNGHGNADKDHVSIFLMNNTSKQVYVHYIFQIGSQDKMVATIDFMKPNLGKGWFKFCNHVAVGGRAKLKKYLFLMPMASLGKKKFL